MHNLGTEELVALLAGIVTHPLGCISFLSIKALEELKRLLQQVQIMTCEFGVFISGILKSSISF